MGFAGFYWVSLEFEEFWIGFTGFCQVILGFIAFLGNFTGFLLGFTSRSVRPGTRWSANRNKSRLS